eukprot:3463893-Pleurochrysis_carterae.AAC.1
MAARSGGNKQTSCLIYSFGSNGDDAWEAAMAKRLPNCEVHIFDPSLSVELAKEVTQRAQGYGGFFHPFGLVAPNAEGQLGSVVQQSSRAGNWTLYTYQQIVEMLGHRGRTVDYFKIDIEGNEWLLYLGHDLTGKRGLFSLCAGDNPELRIGHLNIELHGYSVPRRAETIHSWFAGADACGLRVFHKELNTLACATGGCAEFSLISSQQAHAVQSWYRKAALLPPALLPATTR